MCAEATGPRRLADGRGDVVRLIGLDDDAARDCKKMVLRLAACEMLNAGLADRTAAGPIRRRDRPLAGLAMNHAPALRLAPCPAFPPFRM